MRRTTNRRRRSAGRQWSPPQPSTSTFVAPTGPTIVRLGPGRTMIDPPWALTIGEVTIIRPDARCSGGWYRWRFPMHLPTGLPVAPIDLSVGHALAFTVSHSGEWHQVYAWVTDADERRVVLTPTADAYEAVRLADEAYYTWRAAELAKVDAAWRQRRVDAGVP